MGKLIVVIAIVAALAYAWHKGLIQEWVGKGADSAGRAVDKGIDNVRRTQREATKSRPADPGAPEEKK
jgi:hypothetical protein